MTPRSQRLQPAADQARDRREQALQRLAEQQQRLLKAEQQLAELQRYRNEYALGIAAGGLSVDVLLNRQQFVERIDRAIAQQSIEMERLHRQLALASEGWRQAHAREQALGSVIAHMLKQEQASESRREQSEIDERMQYRRGPTRSSAQSPNSDDDLPPDFNPSAMSFRP
ncbi:flagellar export protein FliJ [Dyella tabacisoli]|uniref:Flagellar FliJ protein n=1 Tax=Dyella tabacisoli TaxID=2282381 RepID=A0A369UJ50_9GAMM|nr:flagellar export protein FliJ [Dyella tabacisoli]RDD79748.1 flagellar export protein FliJ [Dyella tabacisoli]